jgi:hypothetical protein
MLDNPLFRKQLAEEIQKRIDAYCVKIYSEGPRNHLGASIIGNECHRYIWYHYRWVYNKVFSGKQYRLFNRGHREEAKFLEYLRGIGFNVTDVLENGKQQRLSAVMGHFGGSLDGTAFLPPDLNVNEKLLCEFKTKKHGADFNNIVKNGVKFEEPVHYDQMCVYGRFYDIQYAIYIVVNKNNDDMHIEIVKLDHALADRKIELAEKIIRSRQAPNRVASSKNYLACKMCDMSGVCWDNVPPEKNCRSCWKAKPIEDKQWFCEEYNSVIPNEFIKNGCDKWEPVK